MDLTGVPETFGDELTLLAALQLRWHTRLSGQIERALMHQPLDTDAGRRRRMAGHRRRAARHPADARALPRRAPRRPDGRSAWPRPQARNASLLAAMAGRAGATAEATVAAGRMLEERAKARVAA